MELMEAIASPTVAVKKTNLTPKAIIYQKFGTQACYEVEEVQESIHNDCPGLAIPQKGPCLFRCRLQLPEFCVISEICKKKKDAEHSAAEKAIEKLGIHPKTDSITQDPWDGMVMRLSYLFSDEFISVVHPLSGHFRAALQREGDLRGLIPLPVMALCDSNLRNLCKSINSKVESNPLLAVSLIIKAAVRLSGSIVTSEEQLSMRRQNPYPSEVLEPLADENLLVPESFCIQAVYIPYELEKTVEQLSVNVPSNGYYLDAIAQVLRVRDASKVLFSRTIGKASAEMRLYFSAPASALVVPSDQLYAKEAANFEGPFNLRASYFSGQDIHGSAILASIGYTWRSKDLYHEDVSLRTYYRMLISKMPSGLYKLSREATLAANLPVAFTTRANWRGSLPRDLLCTFCRQHRLSEPVFSPLSYTLETLSEVPGSCKRLKVEEPDKAGMGFASENGTAVNGGDSGESQCSFGCEVKIFIKHQDLILECTPREFYKKQSDAVQNAALKILSWLNLYFKEPDMTLEKLASHGNAFHIQFDAQLFYEAFAWCPSVHKVQQRSGIQYSRIVGPHCMNHTNDRVHLSNTEGPESGVSLTNGSFACISYSVFLVTEGSDIKEHLESKDNFEFEIGTEAIIPDLEARVTQLSVGQSTCFRIDMDGHELILAAAGDSTRSLSLLSANACYLEYSVSLLRVTEPLEDRMEQAFFSPPLSKQRIEFTLQRIKESSAKTLVDFGCGSGSLLGSLLDYPSALEIIAGVDISQKSLIRAAKIINSKLSASRSIKSALLYEGSITDADSRLCGYDIGACLEVIEHMEEDQASLFGDVVLSYFRPRVLIVSTPNYEYNVILQRSTLTSREEDPDEKSQSQTSKFRNNDHKFEWTRKQFNCWAAELAKKHNYSVEFSGVGGSADLEPGFASQIAVFRINLAQGDACMKPQENDHSNNIDLAQKYEVLWEWNRSEK